MTVYFLFITIPYSSYATKVIWHQIGGVKDSHITSLAINPSNPNIMYAGTFGTGVIRSSDGGETWSIANTGIADTSYTYMLAMDPSNPTILYLGTDQDGVYNSTNGGLNWRTINNGLLNINVHSAPVIDPSDSATLYVGTEGGVFKSIDGGENWRPVGPSLPREEMNPLAVDPLNPSTIYVSDHYDEWDQGSSDGGLFKSTDGGENWQSINNGLPDTSSRESQVNSIAIHPTDSQILYAGTGWIDPRIPLDKQTGGGGVFKSIDGGENWTSENIGLPDTIVTDLAIDPQNPSLMYAATWGYGIFKSMNGAEEWCPANAGLISRIAFPLIFHPQNSAILYAGTVGGGMFEGKDHPLELIDAILNLRILAGVDQSFLKDQYDTYGSDIICDGRGDLTDVIYALQELAGLH